MSAADGSQRLPAHERSLDPGELDRLLALRAATAENAPMYMAILSAMVAAKDAYQLRLRTDEIVTGVSAISADRVRVGDALRQLQDWSCVTWAQDTTFSATTVEEYLRRHELWELTPIGEATLAAVVALLGASERSGALQRALFRQITESLDGLRSSVVGNEAQGVYLHLRALDSAVGDLARNARDFHATITRTSREDRLEEHIFLLYKEELIAYLQTFHDDLVRHRVSIVRLLDELDTAHRSEILRLASEGDDSVGLFGDPSNWERRWDGMRSWFIVEPPAVSGIAQLAAATTVAIRELLALLRRLTEATTRPIDRSSELTHLARWFARLPPAAAHELFDVSFGLGALTHLSIGANDPEQVPMSTSWWHAEPAPVPVTLRRFGKRPSPGRAPPTADFAVTRKFLEQRRETEGQARADAVSALRTIDLTADRLSSGTWSYLLELIDRALATRDIGEAFEVSVVDGNLELIVRSPAEGSTVLRSEHGQLLVHGCDVSLRARQESIAS